MWRLHHCLALALLQRVSVESFQPVYHRTTTFRNRTPTSRTTWTGSSTTTTNLHAAGLNEADLKVELTGYLKKREEANADDAAKA